MLVYLGFAAAVIGAVFLLKIIGLIIEWAGRRHLRRFKAGYGELYAAAGGPPEKDAVTSLAEECGYSVERMEDNEIVFRQMMPNEYWGRSGGLISGLFALFIESGGLFWLLTKKNRFSVPVS